MVVETERGSGKIQTSEASDDGNFEKASPRVAISERASTLITSVPDLRGWDEHHYLSDSLWKHTKKHVTTVAYLLISLYYIALGAAVAYMNDKPFVAWQFLAMTELIKYSVTLWPITFALLLYQALRSAARYKAERGTRLMTLELLIGSRSFGSSVLAPFSIGKLNLAATYLFLLWVSSPLAGQALQRMFDQGFNPMVSQIQLSYVETSKGPQDFITGRLNMEVPLVNGLYVSSLMASAESQNRSADLWLNPKIPIVGSLTGADPDGWLDPTLSGPNITYSSLLGIPISGIPGDGNTTFNVESAYLELECLPVNVSSFMDLNKTATEAGVWLHPSHIMEGSQGQFPHMYFGIEPNASRIWMSSMSMSDPNMGKINNSTYSHSTCAVFPVLVESQISCDGHSCQVSKVRLSPNNATGTTTFLDPLWGRNSPVMDPSEDASFAGNFPNATGVTMDNLATLTEQYISNPYTLWNTTSQGLQLQDIPMANYQARLRILLNTYYQAAFSWAFQMSGLPEAFPTSVTTPVISETATKVTLEHVYKSCFTWVGLLLLCAVIALIICCATFYLDARTIAPDVLGYASSLTRNNPFTPLPPGGSALDGMERAILAGTMQIKMQDVCPDEEVGLVAFSSAENGTPLQKGRRYQ